MGSNPVPSSKMNLPIDKVKKLYYQNGLSAREVGEELNIPVWQVIRFMKKNNLPRRAASETQKLQFRKKKGTFTIKKNLSKKEEKLRIAGLMLYWAEGVKTSDNTVDLTNSDPHMIKLFLRMLREVYGIKEEKLRVLLYCYANQDIKKLIGYWVKATKIPQKQFIKPYIRQDFLEKKKGKMRYGLVHIRYHDKKLVAKIKKDTLKFLKEFIPPG